MPTNGQYSTWNDAQRGMLREMHAKLWSSAKMAAELNTKYGTHYTRNAMIGACHRLRLPKRKKGVEPAPRHAPAHNHKALSRRGPASSGFRVVTVNDPYLDVPIIDDLSIPVERRRTLLQLTAHNCRWPVGDPKDPSFFFCGDVTAPNKPYCTDHCRVAYVKATGPRPVLVRTPRKAPHWQPAV